MDDFRSVPVGGTSTGTDPGARHSPGSTPQDCAAWNPSVRSATALGEVANKPDGGRLGERVRSFAAFAGISVVIGCKPTKCVHGFVGLCSWHQDVVVVEAREDVAADALVRQC